MILKWVKTYVGNDDKHVESESCLVYWVTISMDSGERGHLIIRNGSSTEGSKEWEIRVQGSYHYLFDPPIRVSSGLFIDVDSSAMDIYTIGYLPEEIVKRWEREG